MPFLDASKKIFKSGLKGAVGGALVGLGTAAVAKKPALAFRENLLDSIDEDTVDDLDKASSLKAKILKPAKKAVGAVKEF
jgi:hypothetical protein|tara:strand:- start:290 stop:529 length:240 start_codon:yes stop_codon:yes gene_type:complete